MNIKLQNRKKSHFLLLGVIILIQIIALLFWYQQKTSQNNFTEANRKALEPNRAFYYANKATYFYFETENNFANYLHKGSENTLKEYRTSLGKMTIYLDSLSAISEKNSNFDSIVNKKATLGKEIISLNKNTVDLIITDIQIGNYSGFDLAIDIKTMKNTNANATIIAITADSFINAIEIDKQNFNAVIIKPIEKEEFYHKLVTVLS
jgi:CheY-like chemotaxis protein